MVAASEAALKPPPRRPELNEAGVEAAGNCAPRWSPPRPRRPLQRPVEDQEEEEEEEAVAAVVEEGRGHP